MVRSAEQQAQGYFVIISGVALATSLNFSWTGNADKIAGFDPAWIVIILCGW